MRRTISTLTLTIIVALAGFSHGAAQSIGCEDLADYQATIVSLIDPDDLADLYDVLSDIERARPSELANASEIADDWATDLDSMRRSEIPAVARDYHVAMVDYVSVVSMILSAVATSGPLGALAYTETMEEITIELDREDRAGERACGADWPFGDDESPDGAEL